MDRPKRQSRWLITRRGNRRRRGSAVLDAVLVLWLLLLVAFGTVEFGYYFYLKHCMQGAAREGARAAISPVASFSDIQAAIDKALDPTGVSAYTLQVQKSLGGGSYLTIDSSNFSSLAAGDSIAVTVQVNWSTAGVRPLGLISANKQVKGVTVMRKEG